MNDSDSEAQHLPSSPIGMYHVASWRNQICSGWSNNPHQEDGSVLRNARTILERARDFLQEMFTEVEVKRLLCPAVSHPPTSALLLKTHCELPPHDLDGLSPDIRANSMAIRGTDLTAIPIDPAELQPPTMAHFGINRSSKVELHLLSDGRVLLSATSPKGRRQHSIQCDQKLDEACARLFRVPDVLPPPDTIPVIARSYPCADLGGAKYVEMPSWLSQRVGEVLQDGFRFHVLLTAAAPRGSHAIVIEKVVLCTPADSKRGCELVVRIHKSSGACICAAHQKQTSVDSHVQVSFSFCGKKFAAAQNARCVRHAECNPNFEDEIPLCCLHNFGCKVTCRHAGDMNPYNFSMDIPDCSVASLRILSAASVALIDSDKDEALRIKETVDKVFVVGEAFETPTSEKEIARDLLAVGLLRAGGVESTMRGEMPVLSGARLSARERTLRTTHSHLFKKRHRK